MTKKNRLPQKKTFVLNRYNVSLDQNNKFYGDTTTTTDTTTVTTSTVTSTHIFNR